MGPCKGGSILVHVGTNNAEREGTNDIVRKYRQLVRRAMQTRVQQIRVQPTVMFPIGDHVNVLHDYKKTRSSKILKLLTCRCHHLIDLLIKLGQSLILLTHLKCMNVPYPSISA